MTGGVGKGEKGVQVECTPCRESRVTDDRCPQARTSDKVS